MSLQVQQQRSSTRSNQKNTMVPLAAAVQSMHDLGAQLTARWNQLYAGFSDRKKLEKPENNSTAF